MNQGYSLEHCFGRGKKVAIADRPEGIGDPGHKEHCSLQNEAVAMGRNTQPVEPALEGIAREQNLEIGTLCASPIEQAGPHRRANIAAFTWHQPPSLRHRGASLSRPALFVRNAPDQTISAAKYSLLIISEAATKRGDLAADLCPSIPWREIRGMGNRLRDDYQSIDVVRIWLLIARDLPPLKAACRDGSARHGGGQIAADVARALGVAVSTLRESMSRQAA